MQGKRTWIGLIIILVGFLGVGEFVSEAEIGKVIDLLTQLAGLIFAIYGNYKSHAELKSLGGYRK